MATLSTIAASRSANLLAESPDAGMAGLVGGFRPAYLASAVLLGAAALLIMLLLRRRHLASLEASASTG